jgi:sphingolipid delta-4 desaturase
MIENHIERSKRLMIKYPQIKEISSVCIFLKYQIIFLFGLSIFFSYLSSFLDNIQYILFTWLIGGTLLNSITLGMHEVSHNHAFKSFLHNRILSLICDLSIGLPVSESFRRYHHLHHYEFNKVGLDTDLPSNIERIIFKGKLGKFIWIILQGFFYSIRPNIIKPLEITKIQFTSYILNIIRFIILYQINIKAALFSIIAILIGTGLHPFASHFIAEHFYNENKYETASYYGWMNILTFNVGYHVEHHDFPHIPGSKLPLLHKITNEYKDNIPIIKSWILYLIKFIMDDNISLDNRLFQ